MNSALLKERAEFKKRALATPVLESKKKVQRDDDEGPSKKKIKKEAPAPPKAPREAAGALAKDPFAYKSMQGTSQHNFSILTKIVKYMRKMYLDGDSHSLSIDEILDETNQLDIGPRQRVWLEDALPQNKKMERTLDGKYIFKPPFKIKDRKGLIRLLDKHDREGNGAINIEDVQESLPNADKAIKLLTEKEDIVMITRPSDKKKILFYNDRSVQMKVDEEFQKLWRSVTVDGLDEDKIDEYLQKHGIASMQDTGKKFTPMQKRKKPSRKGKTFKKTNTHVAADLQDYSDRQ